MIKIAQFPKSFLVVGSKITDLPVIKEPLSSRMRDLLKIANERAAQMSTNQSEV